ncbi:MAG: sugar phosphate isomerase/epimerase family protein [Thermoguttaceae bacterium]
MSERILRRRFLGEMTTASLFASSATLFLANLTNSACSACSACANPGVTTPTKSEKRQLVKKPFQTALNFGTLIGFDLSLEREIDIAAQAGYEGIEPWSLGLDRFIEKGGKIADLRKRIDDHGLQVTTCNMFYPWIVEDPGIRAKGIEQMKRYMDYAAELGGTRITATSVGASEHRLDDFAVLGGRYRTILEIGEQRGVLPQLEMCAGTQTLNCLADLFAVAIHAGHPKTEFLLDVFHLYRSGSPFESLALLNGKKMSVLHFNDFPASPPRETIEDKDRVYPGDGVAPLLPILQTLRNVGFDGFLSFEVFNPGYWSTNDPLKVVQTGRDRILQYIDQVQ